jgi:serine phosphatase RsbU (regulator of sigma subunit)
MKQLYNRFIDYFVYEPYKSDPERYRRSRFAIIAIWFFNLVDIASIAFSPAFNDSYLHIIPNASLFVIKLGMLFLFRKNGSLAMLAHGIAVLNAFILLSATIQTGGIFDPNLSWLVISPIIALIISSIRVAIFWLCFSVVQLLFTYYNNKFLWIELQGPELLQDPFYYLVAYMGGVVIVSLLVIRNERIRLLLLGELQKKSSELESKNKEITDSITYAERIQKAILPSHSVLEHYLGNSFVLYLPKDIVSGDFYWVESKNNITYFAVCDCTGHGVPGAMMSVIGQNALNRVLNEFNLTEPGAMLDKLSVLVEESFAKSGAEVRDGMDIALCSLDRANNKLAFAGANNSLFLLHNGELKEVKANKQPIGRFESRVPFATHYFGLHSGDRLFLFTDGIADQFGGPNGKKFKHKRVKELLISSSAGKPGEQKKSILEAFYDWKKEQEQVDDVCVLGINI